MDKKRLRILIAYDGSMYADDALDDLPRAGLPREADALVANVQERWLSPPTGSEIVYEVYSGSESAAVKAVRVKEDPELQTVADESTPLGKAGAQIKSFFPEWNVETLILRGSPSYQITKRAREWNADLIAVGSQGEKAGKLYSLGSVSQKIANEAHCSVRIVRGGAWKRNSPVRILIGLDGTAAAHEAVKAVARRMWMPGSEVRLVTVKDSPQYDQTKAESYTSEWIEKFQGEAEQILKNCGLAVSRVVEAGDPKAVLVSSAAEWGADCVFIGSNDTGNFFENHLLGSVATAIVARAHCTVEVVRVMEDTPENV